MRCVAGVGLLALVGCNQIFGIAPTTAWDAGIDGDLAMPHARLTWQIAAVTGAGVPAPTVDYAPIVPAPQLRMAPIDVALDDSADRATYQAGVIPIPGGYVGATWRLEYTLADGVPHEVQWAPDDQVGHVAIPLFGRLERASWPQDGGYSVTPSNPPASYAAPRVLTTGLWTEGRAQVNGPRIDYAYFNATSLSGSKGGPEPARGDRAFVVDYQVDGAGCQVAVGSAMLTSAALLPEPRDPQSVEWAVHPRVPGPAIPVLSVLTRLTNAIGTLHASGYVGTLLFGVGANPLMPGLTSLPAVPLLSSTATLPVPTLLTLLRCPFNPAFGVAPPTTMAPLTLAAFPPLLHLQISHTRTISQLADVALTSGISTVAIASLPQSSIEFSAAIPLTFQLTNPAQQTFDLGGAADRIAVGDAGGTFRFTFAVEPPGSTNLRADHFDVVLHRIAGGALTTRRIYTVTSPAVRIDGPVLENDTDYVFEIRAYRGHPNAQRGDFATVTYPYGSATVFTRTFRTVSDGQ
jgi:hypothetical protein